MFLTQRALKMRNNRKYLLAGAALAALPAVSNAAVVTFAFDPNAFFVETTTAGANLTQLHTGTNTVNGQTVTLSGTNAAPSITLPVGDFILYGLTASVGNTNGGFGITAFQTGATPSNTSAGVIAPGPTAVNTAAFSSGSAKGTATAGFVDPQAGTFGQVTLGGTTSTASNAFGVAAPISLYTTQRINPVAASNASFTNVIGSNNTAITFASLGAVVSSSQTYVNRLFNPVTDSVAALPVLTVNYGSTAVTTATSTIISLTNQTAGVPTAYGTDVGDLTVTGSSALGYAPKSEAVSPAKAIGYAGVTFTVPPTAGVEVYALKLSSSAADAQIVADINAQSATDGVTASLVSSNPQFAFQFPGYDILLTANAANALNPSSYLGFDLSGETGAAAGITVTNVAAVPEPATATGLVLGAAGLLLGRRKSRVA